MKMRYQISTWRFLTADKAADFRQLQRKDAALDELWRQIYSMLEGDGALDTERAWRLRRQFNDVAANVNLGLRRGHFRHVKFYLHEKETTGARVDFWQERV